MNPHRQWFIPGSYRQLSTPQKVHFGDNSFAEASGVGTIWLENVLHVPVFSLTLILVYRLTKANYTSIFSKQSCQIVESSSKKVRMLGNHKNGLYHLNVKPIVPTDKANVAVNINVLHR
ncbi:hypothetical protein K439DRAFT_1357266 [Ramaria rubella]|nr:hypothetical protein K439DRAFT_1357266 [Ramaria rubella]